MTEKSLKEVAKEIGLQRQKKWRDAWDEWDLSSFVDHIIAKLKRAWNAPEETKECLIDCYNYSKELKTRLKADELRGR